MQPKIRFRYYVDFLKAADNNEVTVDDIIQLGVKLFKKQKLHHHFYGDYSWLATAKALTYYGLNGDDYPNYPNYLKEDPENLKQKLDQKLNQKLDTITCKAIFNLFEKRIQQRLPVEYMTHQAEYCGRVFYVNQHVLVPRSIMSGRFKEFLEIANWENHKVLDLCTGSGCIGITLALLNTNIQVDLSDISPKALDVACINIENYHLNNRVKCIQSDAFENIQDKYDLIISNPPYVSIKEYENTPGEFKAEPKIALESGIDGLNMVHNILKNAKQYLNNEGILIVELGPQAAGRLKKCYPKVNFKWFHYKKPNGKECLFSSPGVFLCKRSDLEYI